MTQTQTGRGEMPKAGRTSQRRASFALEPVSALPRYAERIHRLAAASLEQNPFFLPDFLGPAAQALRPSRLRLAVITDRDDLIFFAPVRLTGGFGGGSLAVWTHDYAPLGVPLVERGRAETVADVLFDFLRDGGRGSLAIDHLPLEGPVARLLRRHAGHTGSWTEARVEDRPILFPDGVFEIAPKRRKELERQMRRLAEEGALSLMTARSHADVETAFDAFVALESSGWKGRRGTAMARKKRIREFCRTAVLGLADRGMAEIDLLRCGDRAASVLIRFETGGLAVPWKIAYDESLAAFSPGKQLMSDASRRWMVSTKTSRVDPVCDPDNAMLSLLWQDKERYGTLMVGTSRLGLGINMRGSLIDAGMIARRRLKRLIRR